MKLDEIIANAKDLGSYLVTVTTKDKNKEENDLEHHIFRQEFPLDDVIPSLDHAVRCMGIVPEPTPDVVKPPRLTETRKPLKIAIITHFNRCPDSYSPGKAVKHQVKLLQQYGHIPVFFVAEGSKLDVGCEMRPVMPKFKREKWVVDEEGKHKLIDVFREQLTSDFDLAITHDFYIDDCITYREAIRECGVPIRWLHWARSGVGRPLDFKMDNAKYVYMNYADSGRFADRINVDHRNVRVVQNTKDPALLFDWHPTTKMISDKMRLWEKDIIQTYPVCTTRLDAKGLDSVVAVFAELKRLGKNVALIICNSNGRRRLDEIKAKMEMAARMGLTEDEFVFTNTLHSDEFDTLSEVPNQVVRELMQVSNLFVFPTIAEVSSNVLLEASMTKNLLVLNEDLPCLFDATDNTAVLKYPFTSTRSMHYTGRTQDEYTQLAKQIVGQLESNKADKQFRHVWRNYSMDAIYHNQLAPILYEQD